MSAPAVPVAVARPAAARPAGGPTARPGWSSSGCAPRRSFVYLFLYLPILVVVLFAFNDTTGVAAS